MLEAVQVQLHDDLLDKSLVRDASTQLHHSSVLLRGVQQFVEQVVVARGRQSRWRLRLGGGRHGARFALQLEGRGLLLGALGAAFGLREEGGGLADVEVVLGFGDASDLET